MKQWTIEPPDLPAAWAEGEGLRAAADECMRTGEDVQNRRFFQEELSGLSGGILEFSGCLFERCTMSEWGLKRVGFVDCVFDQCEMSNLNLNGAAVRRVRFKGCRMTGVGFADGALMDASFEGCMMDYLSMGECKLDRVKLNECRMRESMWTNVQLKRVAFENDDLRQTQWSHTPLLGMDMTSCQIEGFHIDLFDLRGLKVTESQVLCLSGLLGVEVVEEGWQGR